MDLIEMSGGYVPGKKYFFLNKAGYYTRPATKGILFFQLRKPTEKQLFLQ